MALFQPVWSRIDEAQHTDFIVQLSHGTYPIADATLISPEVLGIMKSTGVYRGDPVGTYPAPDLADFGLPPQGMSDTARAAWMSRHRWQLSFESVQTPGYYLVMVPVWWLADHAGGPLAAVYAIRLIGALLIASLAPMAVSVARVLSPTRPEIAVVAALFAILLPGLDLNGTRVSNDALATVLGGLVVLLAVRWAGTPWSWRRAVLVGLLLGAGLMVKLTLGGLLPAVALAAVWPGNGTALRHRLAVALLACAIALACLAPWFLINMNLYGVVSPGTRAAQLSDAIPSALTAAFIPFDVAVFNVTYWSGEPFGALPLALGFSLLGALIALMALSGVIRMVRVRSLPISAGPLWVGIVAVGGMAAVTLLLPATAGYEFAGPGRYAYPALPAAAALTAVGIAVVLTQVRARRAVAGLYAVASLGILGAGAAGLPMPPQAGSGTPPAGAQIVSALSSGELNGMVIDVQRVALDTGRRAVWVEVDVRDNNVGEAEWPVVPVATAGGVTAHGDYLQSTHMPGDIDPGEHVTGWLFLPLDPANIRQGELLHLRFPDVAVDGYRTVGDVYIDVAVTT
jgi:hypothetical protein